MRPELTQRQREAIAWARRYAKRHLGNAPGARMFARRFGSRTQYEALRARGYIAAGPTNRSSVWVDAPQTVWVIAAPRCHCGALASFAYTCLGCRASGCGACCRCTCEVAA